MDTRKRESGFQHTVFACVLELGIRLGGDAVVVERPEGDRGARTDLGSVVDDLEGGVLQEVVGLRQHPVRPVAWFAVGDAGDAWLKALTHEPERVLDGRDVDAAGEIEASHCEFLW